MGRTVPYWKLSGFYFFYFASLGVLVPYWSLYLKSLGFNSLTIGALVANTQHAAFQLFLERCIATI